MNETITLDSESPEVAIGRKIFLGFGVMAAGKVVLTSIGFATRVVLARFLAPAGFGLYGLLTHAVALTVDFSNMGTENTHIHDLGRGKSTVGSALGFSILYSLLAGLLAVIGFSLIYDCWLYDWYFSKYIGQRHSPLIWVFLVIPVRILMLHLTNVLLGLKRFKTYNVFLAIRGSALLALVVVLCPKVNPTVLGALMAWVGSAVITALLMLLYLGVQVGSRIRVNLSEVLPKLTYGVKVMASGLADSLALQLGLFAPGYFLAPKEVGLFFLAFTLFNMAGQGTTILGRVLFPYNSTVDLENGVIITNTIFRFLFAVSILSLLLSIPASVYGVPLFFGTSYTKSGFLLIVLLPGAIALSLARVIYVFFLGQGHPGRGIRAYISCLIGVGLLNFLLLPRVGIFGASMALSGGYIIGLVIIIYDYVSFAKTTYRDLCLVKLRDFVVLKRILLEMRQSLPRVFNQNPIS